MEKKDFSKIMSVKNKKVAIKNIQKKLDYLGEDGNKLHVSILHKLLKKLKT